jgi:hypothetical protein
MQRYIARIIRALIVSSLGFGGGIGLLVCIAMLCLKGDQRAFEYGIRAGLLFGGIFAAMLVGVLLPLDLSTHLFLSKENKPELWELEQVRELVLDGSLKEVTALARRALLMVPNVKLVTEDPEKNMINASIGTSWRSSGEQMRVEITPVSDADSDTAIAANKWRLRCYSASPSKNIVFDYGKNFENVDSFERHIKRLVTEKDHQPA